jgi:hypothetical protein
MAKIQIKALILSKFSTSEESAAACLIGLINDLMCSSNEHLNSAIFAIELEYSFKSESEIRLGKPFELDSVVQNAQETSCRATIRTLSTPNVRSQTRQLLVDGTAARSMSAGKYCGNVRGVLSLNNMA